MTATLLQITDPHLFANPAARLKDVPTRETFVEVLDLVRREFTHADRYVLTGDFAHDEVEETYRVLRELLGDLVERCWFIPGNHDHRPFMRRVFPEQVAGTGDEPVVFSDSVEGWRLLGLDSHDPGEVPGRLSDATLDWFAAQLDEHRREPTLVFVHHPPIDIGCPWLDELRLTNPDRLLELLAANDQIRALCTGHIHADLEATAAGRRMLSAPSTALQFDLNTTESTPEPLPPGFRVFELDADGFATRVARLPRLRYPPQNEPAT